MTVIITDEGSRLNDYDFRECLKYAPFNKEDVKDILAMVAGGADGDAWHYIVELKNGKFGYITGWCDYTGWGCQEGGDGFLCDTLAEAIEKAPEKNKNVRATLKNQIEGKESYGVLTINPNTEE